MGIERARFLGLSAANFLAHELHTAEVGAGSALSYTPADRTRVINISALAARLLARAATSPSGAALRTSAERLMQFVLQHQRADGGWPYGAERGSDWEDSFHTGYVLESLLHLKQSGLDVPSEALERGLTAYAGFFGTNGESRLYRAHSTILDAHSAAQGVITYLAAGEAETAARIVQWTLDALWIEERGHFAYRIVRGRRDEREFIRWVQAWMALAMGKAAALESTTEARSHLAAASR